MKSCKIWYFTVLVLIALSISLIVVVNYLIDPYNVFKTPTVNGFNLKKIETKEYLMKAREIVLYKPDIIFLGSSRTRNGLDPSYYFESTGERAYNCGLSSAGIYEQMRYLEYALLNNNSLKKVIVGVDFAAFNELKNDNKKFDEKQLNSSFFAKDDMIRILLTKQSIKDSIHVLLDNSMNENKYTANKYLQNGSANEEEIILQSEKMMKQGKNRFFEHLKDYLKEEGNYGKFALSKQKISYFEKIISICEENSIELTVLIHPAHALQWEGIKKAGLWSEFEEWKKEIVNIYPVWDFSGYNSITTSPPDNFINYTDQSHYRKKIGNYVFNRILHVNEESIPDDFGVFLTKDNMQEHLIKIRKEQETWEMNNPDILEKIKDL
ncbi:hypothetical protein [Petroclostridium sp. X23]|uniref:hypothetical protein n=1 Tax=Petroclostridium sp. X23 TaxID=3045146 RepID=UPI0024AE15D0|nr:hypothetical protein [Petroclostridium sp. X23]WHH57503.1 hypothetical protein QKW49_16925 [Petroclostridium sp. X23]